MRYDQVLTDNILLVRLTFGTNVDNTIMCTLILNISYLLVCLNLMMVKYYYAELNIESPKRKKFVTSSELGGKVRELQGFYSEQQQKLI